MRQPGDYLVLFEPDQQGRAAELLLWQQKGKPRIEGFTRALGLGAQLAEGTGWAVLAGSLLDSAEGATLDRIGELVGEFRGGLTHEQYRVFIGLRIEVNSLFQNEDRIWSVLTRALYPSVVTSGRVADGIIFTATSSDWVATSLASHAAALLRDFRPAAIYAALTEQLATGARIGTVAVPGTLIGTIATPGSNPIGRLLYSGRSRR